MIYIFGLILTLITMCICASEEAESIERVKQDIKYCPKCARKHNAMSPYVLQFTRHKLYLKCCDCGEKFSPNEDE